MPRDITVTFEDGSTHIYKNAPDGVSPEQVSERAASEFQKPVKAMDGGKQGPSMGRRVLNSAIAGFGKVAADAPRALMNVLPFPEEAAKNAYQASDDIRAYYDEIGKQGAPGYAGAAIEGATGALAGGGAAAPVKSAISGAFAGLGSEAGGNLFGDNPLARAIGGFLGGLAGAGGANAIQNRARGLTPNAADLAEKTLRGVDDGMLQKAKLFQASAAKDGVTVDLVQALEAVGAPAGSLKTVRDMLANHEAGSEVQKVLRTQPKELDMLATTTVAKLPGNVLQPDAASNNVQKAATARVNVEKSARSAAVRDLYAQAGELPETARKALGEAIDASVAGPGITDAVKASAAELKRKLGAGEPLVPAEFRRAQELARQAIATAPNASTKLELQRKLAEVNKAIGEPPKPLHALDVDTAVGEATGPYKGTPLTPVNPKEAGQMKNLAGNVNRTLQNVSPEVAAAEQKFAEITRTQVDPLKQGPVGQLATPRGAKPDVQASVAKLNAIFSEGVDPQALGPSKVLTLAKELKKVDPEAFPDAAKTYISGKLATVDFSKDNAAQALSAAMFDNPKQYQGLRDMAAGIADSRGLKREEVVRGLDNLKKITEALKSRPGTVGGLNEKEVLEASGKSLVANAMRIFGFLPFERTARGVENFVSSRTLKEFDKLLTSKEGAETLAKLGKMDPGSPKAITLLANFSLLQADTQAEPK